MKEEYHLWQNEQEKDDDDEYTEKTFPKDGSWRLEVEQYLISQLQTVVQATVELATDQGKL